MKIKKAQYMGDGDFVNAANKFSICFKFDNDEAVLCDFSTFDNFFKGIFEELKDIEKFKQFYIEDGVLKWSAQQDVCPNLVYQKGKKVKLYTAKDFIEEDSIKISELFEVVNRTLQFKGISILYFVEDSLYRARILNRNHPKSLHYIIRSDHIRHMEKSNELVMQPPFWSWTGDADGTSWEINSFGSQKALEDYIVLYSLGEVAVIRDVLLVFWGMQPKNFKVEEDKIIWC